MHETRVTFTLNRLVSVVNSHADAILRARYGMTFSQFIFLINLRGQKLSVTDLAHRLEVSTAAVSKRAPWFEERGLVRFHDDPAHGRKVLLSLTPKGDRLAEQASADLEEAFVEKFADMRALDLLKLNASLNQMLEHLISVPKEGT